MSCYYRMEERVRLLGKEPPEVWENILAVIPHEELSVAPLPTGLRPPPHIVRGKEQRYCRTTFEAGQVAGFFHVPAHTRQATHNCAFTWCGSNVLLVAYDDFVQVCLHRVGQLSAHKNAGSADFIVDFLSVLIQDELPPYPAAGREPFQSGAGCASGESQPFHPPNERSAAGA